MITDLKTLKYITYRRFSDSSSTFFPWEFFLKKNMFLENAEWKIIKKTLLNRNKSLYVHIPFCITECLYCACFKKKISTWDDLGKYIRYILKELKMYFELNNFEKLFFETLVFGWGTPSILSVDNLDILFEWIYSYIAKESLRQVSFEVAPYLLNFPKIDILKKHWVNRISFWIQSFDKEVLTRNNRPYISFEKINFLLDYAKKIWIECVWDLMIWLKWQDLKICIQDYKSIISLWLDDFTINYFYSNKETKYTDSINSFKTKKEFQKIAKTFPHNSWNSILLQEKLIEQDYCYTLIWLWIWAISIFDWVFLTKKSDFVVYYNNLDIWNFPIDSSLFLDKKYIFVKYLSQKISDKKISLNKVDNILLQKFYSDFSEELSFLQQKGIIALDEKYLYFLKDILTTQIYFSTFFSELISLEELKKVDNFENRELSIFIAWLIDEL